MPNIIASKSKVNSSDKFGIVVSRFNQFITDKLLEGCLETLKKNSVNDKNIDVIWVPGTFEIPTAAKNLLDLKKYSAVICIGCVIRGETPHFEYICSAVSNEIAYLGVLTGVPVIFGVLTCDNVDQAQERAGGRVGNKGSEAALAALEMVNLISELKLCTL